MEMNTACVCVHDATNGVHADLLECSPGMHQSISRVLAHGYLEEGDEHIPAGSITEGLHPMDPIVHAASQRF